MPAHDWTRVDAGIFHDFHNSWVMELRNVLNNGLLPRDYYALTEQHAGRYIADILTLHAAPEPPQLPPPSTGMGTAVAEAPPKARVKMTASSGIRQRRRTLAIRHVSGHRLVAILEIVSPGNKDRKSHVEELAGKVQDALRLGVHVLLVDLFPPGQHDPQGMHGVIWEEFGDEPFELPRNEPLIVASYVAGSQPDAYLEFLSVGDRLPDTALFFQPERYANVPLESAYLTAYGGFPEYWRKVLEEN